MSTSLLTRTTYRYYIHDHQNEPHLIKSYDSIYDAKAKMISDWDHLMEFIDTPHEGEDFLEWTIHLKDGQTVIVAIEWEKS